MKIYSLGYNCQVEMNLEKMQRKRENNRSRISIPFNWTITPRLVPILQMLSENKRELFKQVSFISVLHNGQNYRKKCCLQTDLIGFHEGEEDITTEEHCRLQAKYNHLMDNLCRIVIQERDNVFLRYIGVDSFYKISLTQMIDEIDAILEFLHKYGHKVGFLCDKKEYCNRPYICHIDTRSTRTIYASYKRVIDRQQWV